MTEADLARIQAHLTELVDHVGGLWSRRMPTARVAYDENRQSLVDAAASQHAWHPGSSNDEAGAQHGSAQASDFPTSNAQLKPDLGPHQTGFMGAQEQERRATYGILRLILNLFKSRGKPN